MIDTERGTRKIFFLGGDAIPHHPDTKATDCLNCFVPFHFAPAAVQRQLAIISFFLPFAYDSRKLFVRVNVISFSAAILLHADMIFHDWSPRGFRDILFGGGSLFKISICRRRLGFFGGFVFFFNCLRALDYCDILLACRHVPIDDVIALATRRIPKQSDLPLPSHLRPLE